MLSSLGWTTTKPCPEKAIWNASPLPRPISDDALKLRLAFIFRPDDQATRASGSSGGLAIGGNASDPAAIG